MSEPASRSRVHALSARWAPRLALGAGPALLFGPMLLRGEALYWGTVMLQFVPWRAWAAEMIGRGALPLWNPLVGAGAPLLANHQSALLYPPTWLSLAIGPAWGEGLLAALHLVLAGAGMCALARRLGLGTPGQTVAGVAFSLSGYLVARSGFPSMLAAAAWLPWVALGADRTADLAAGGPGRRATGRAALGLALALAMQWLAGHAQTAWYTLWIAGLFTLWRGGRVGGWRGIARAAAAAAGACALAFALAAAQLLPTAEYLRQSARAAGVAPDLALTYSFWPWRALGLWMPDLFGSPARGDYWGYGNYWEDAIYLGVLPALLALGAVARSLRGCGRLPELMRLLAVAALAAFVLALGDHTPAFPWLYQHVPTFDLFQAPTRWNLVGVFSLALLAGVGAEDSRPPRGWSLYWSRLGSAGAVALSVAALYWGPRLPGVEPSLVGGFARCGVVLALCGALALLRERLGPALWAAAASLLVVGDLVAAGWGMAPSAPRALYTQPTGLAQDLGGEGRLYMPPELEYELKFGRFFRFDSFDPALDRGAARRAGLPNTAMLDGLASANNFDPLLPASFADWMERLSALDEDARRPYLARLGVGWQAQADPEAPEGVRYHAVEGARRVWVAPQAEFVASRPEALARLFAPGGPPAGTVILEAAPVERAGGAGTAVVLDDANPNRLTVAVAAPSGGWLVVADAWSPGWRAALDGAPVEIVRADGLLRAVWIPPGEHTVEFRYAPASFSLGAALSLMAWAACALAARAWRRT